MEKKVKEKESKISSKKVWGLRTLDFFLTILPLVILVIVRHEKYIYSKTSAIGFSAGAVIAVVVIVLTIFKKLHLSGLAFSIIGLALCYFLRNLINDIEDHKYFYSSGRRKRKSAKDGKRNKYANKNGYTNVYRKWESIKHGSI